MMMANDDSKLYSQQAACVFADLLDSLIVDVASEAHRVARLGLDPRLNVDEEEEIRLSAHARSVVGDPSTSGLETGNKYGTDIFGQTHPAVASEVFECMNCGRPIIAGRFAPHLEKCMGKGRRARLKAARNTNSAPQRRARTSPISSYSTAPCSGASQISNRTPNRTPTLTPEDSQRNGLDATEGTSEESHGDDEKISELDNTLKPLHGQGTKRNRRSLQS